MTLIMRERERERDLVWLGLPLFLLICRHVFSWMFPLEKLFNSPKVQLQTKPLKKQTYNANVAEWNAHMEESKPRKMCQWPTPLNGYQQADFTRLEGIGATQSQNTAEDCIAFHPVHPIGKSSLFLRDELSINVAGGPLVKSFLACVAGLKLPAHLIAVPLSPLSSAGPLTAAAQSRRSDWVKTPPGTASINPTPTHWLSDSWGPLTCGTLCSYLFVWETFSVSCADTNVKSALWSLRRILKLFYHMTWIAKIIILRHCKTNITSRGNTSLNNRAAPS